MLGGACMVVWGACMVALGGHAWLLWGVCTVATGGCAWFLWGGGMHGCSGGHAWFLLGGACFLPGVCMLFAGGCACFFPGGCACFFPLYCEKGTPPKKGGASRFSLLQNYPHPLSLRGRDLITSPLSLTLEPHYMTTISPSTFPLK